MNLRTRKTRNILIGLFTLCSLGLSLSIFADTKKENPLEIRVDSNEKSQPIFQLKLNNKEAGQYVITIEDGNGNQIYSEKVSGTNVIKKYRFKDADENLSDGNMSVVFKVTSVKTGKTQAYEVSATSQTVQAYSIAKL